jgi:hypothetical protein
MGVLVYYACKSIIDNTFANINLMTFQVPCPTADKITI